MAITNALKSIKARYVVIGGIAASVWGRPRMTLDADIVLMASSDDIAVLLASLREHGFEAPKTAPKKLSDLLPVKIKYGKKLSVDLRIASYSIDKQALSRARSITFFNTKLLIASREDIVVYKTARFNDLDRADIKSILLRSGKNIDSTYIRTECKKLAEETGDARIMKNCGLALSWQGE